MFWGRNLEPVSLDAVGSIANQSTQDFVISPLDKNNYRVIDDPSRTSQLGATALTTQCVQPPFVGQLV